MSDLVKSKRLAAARETAASSHLDGEDENIPDVSATPNESSSTATTKPEILGEIAVIEIYNSKLKT